MRWDIAAAALTYSWRGWPVFPCRVENGNKRPLVKEWQHVASTDEQQIREWWPRRFPHAAIGVPTGHGGARFVVLDIDVKRAQDNGFDTLAELGHAVLPDTPMVHTPSGGLHLYFDPGDRLIRNTAGKKGRGIGRGLDVRGDGGFVVVPGPGSGYRWDPVYKIDHLPLALAPDWLVAPEPDHHYSGGRPVHPSAGLSPYAEMALDRACRRIIAAPVGEQEITLHSEAFAIGTLAGARGIPADFARRTLLWAARQICDYDPRRPWRPEEVERKVNRAFDRGLQHPRKASNG
jgi:hypothetical protein